MTKSRTTKRILVLGAGFGGAYTIKRLQRYIHRNPSLKLTLVNDTNYFLFTPLIHEVATGSISANLITEPIRQVLGCCLDHFLLAKVVSINLDRKAITTTKGILSYDYLVIALGSTTNSYATRGVDEYAFKLKNYNDALRLKNHIISQFEKATTEPSSEKREQILRTVIIGAGPTGVELSAELVELIKKTLLQQLKNITISNEAEIILIEKSPQILPETNEKFRRLCVQTLQRKGVCIKTNSQVSGIDSNTIYLKSGQVIKSETAIWVAGIKPQEVDIKGSFARDKQGRLVVNDCLQLPQYPEVFALGDIANFHNAATNRSVPALAQVATKQAEGVAININALLTGKRLKKYFYKHSGDLLSLGNWMAVANIKMFYFTGPFAWWLWRTIYLTKLLSWRKRLKVAIDWTWNIFTPRDISQL